jgi:mono/diheme cytochrome c family protein
VTRASDIRADRQKLPTTSPLSRELLRFGRFLAVLAVVVASVPPAGVALAHEIPRHVGVRAWVAPSAGRVRLLVQIPMDAVRDVDFPVRANTALDVARSAPYLRDAAQLWIADALRLRRGTEALPAPRVVSVRAALPSDRAFESFRGALDAVQQAPLAESVDIPHGQLRLEALLEVPVSGDVRDLVLTPAWANLGVRTTTVLTLVNADGGERQYAFEGNPGDVRVDPRWWHVAGTFVVEGAQHLLLGYDHLLFLLCLVLPFRQLRPLIGVVTAFTVAHSVTLVASAQGFVPDVAWFGPAVEVVIAASIVCMAVANLLRPALERRWMWAFAFGLVHGFGFSAALRDTLQFAGSHLLTSLLAFNVGVELAQVAALVLAIPVLERLLARVPERPAIMVASAFVAHEAWHWTQARWDALRVYPFVVPTFDSSASVIVLRGLMSVLVLVALVWMLQALMTRLTRRSLASAAPLALLALATLAAPGTRADAQSRSTMAGVYTPDQATKGREVFNSNCLGCHTTATHQGPAFQNKWFGRPLFDLYDYLSQAMPKAAPGSLTEDEYVWVTAYILRLNGMPPGRTELNPEPAWLKSVRVDSTRRATGALEAPASQLLFGSSQLGRSQFDRAHDSRHRARTENP